MSEGAGASAAWRPERRVRQICPIGASGATVRAPMARLTYLDHAATTPLDERVLEAMLPYLRERWGNPSSLYTHGRVARRALDESRDTVSQVLNCRPSEVLFTSGGTESDNLA